MCLARAPVADRNSSWEWKILLGKDGLKGDRLQSIKTRRKGGSPREPGSLWVKPGKGPALCSQPHTSEANYHHHSTVKGEIK